MGLLKTGGLTMSLHTRFVVVMVTLALMPFVWQPASSAQINVIPGSSTRGAELFQTKNCVACHSYGTIGGKTAPNLAQSNENVRTPIQLASVLWNHAPRMWQAQRTRLIKPLLDSAETADLFAYFYSLFYSKAPGDAVRGAHVFEEKGCAGCHQTTPSSKNSGLSRHLGPPISTWTKVDDPMTWAERMWNHSAKVDREMAGTGSQWPQFSAQEMMDLLTYLRALPESRSQAAVFQPGDPELGHVTFERRCESCHTFGKDVRGDKIDLLQRPRPEGLTAYVAMMWNHAPLMHARAGSDFPILGPGDMNNLVAYLFSKRYFDETGNVERGARLFESKSCAGCHVQRRKQTGAPDLTLGTERYSPITISAAVWRHGPSMFETVQRERLSWPELQPGEMLDLISYLNSKLVSRIAAMN
jgi:cytochrome c2